MGKAASPYCLYEEEKIIDEAEHIVFEYFRWQGIVGVMTSSRENLASVTNYVDRILRLKKRDLEALEQVDVPA